MTSDQLIVIDGRDLGITILEDEVIDTYLPRIKPEGLALYTVLARLAKRGNLTPTQTELGAMMGWNRNTVAKWLGVLEEVGLLTSERRYEQNLEIAKAYTLLGAKKAGTGTVPAGAQKAGTDPTTTNGKAVTSAWLQLTGGAVNPMHIELLGDYVQEFGETWVLKAIKETAASKTPLELRGMAPKYLASILTRWQREGVDPSKPVSDSSNPEPGRIILR